MVEVAEDGGREEAAGPAYHHPLQQQVPDNSPADRAPTKASHAEPLREEQPTQDNAQIVNRGTECLAEVVPHYLERPHHQAAQEEAYLRGEQDSREGGSVGDLVKWEPGV